MTGPQYEKLTQKDLDAVLKKHEMFRTGMRGGLRANLKFKDLSELDFS